jgi:hypothetical protein
MEGRAPVTQSVDLIRTEVRDRLEAQRGLVEGLLLLREQLPGSVFARWSVCGKPGCSCGEGKRHGPYWVLSARSGGKGSFAYVPEDKAEEARGLVGRHREFRQGLKRLKQIGEELGVLLKNYQEVMAREGGQKLGLPRKD